MKKFLCFIFIASGVIALSSCSKEKDCNCTITAKTAGMDPMVTTVQTTVKSGKCSDLNDTQTVTTSGIKVTATTVCK